MEIIAIFMTRVGSGELGLAPAKRRLNESRRRWLCCELCHSAEFGRSLGSLPFGRLPGGNGAWWWLRVPSILTPWLVPFPPVRYWTPGRAEHGRMVECVTDAGLDCGLG